MAKRFISIACTLAIIFSLLATPAAAASFRAGLSEYSVDELSFDLPELPGLGYDSSELSSSTLNYDLSGEGKLLADFSNSPAERSSSALYQEMTGTITEEGTYSYALVNLSEGQIFHATLTCPESDELDYGLLLCEVADDGTLTVVADCNLGTYIDPQTGKTVDEGISYIHNQATVQTYAILVMSYTGSSETYGFKLTVSIDVAGSYDSYEPNENPFDAVSMSLSTSVPVSGKISASLNTPNDQDWYVIEVENYGVFNLSAGDYVVEPYYVTDGTKLVRAVKADDNYVLEGGMYYYVKVYSDKSAEEFSYGPYTLSIANVEKYSTVATAFDMGYWENAASCDSIPRGQQVAYFKFTLDTYDKVYVYLNLLDTIGKYTLIAVSSSGEKLGESGPDDVVTSSTGLKRNIVDVDGTDASTVYLCVINYDPLSYYRGMVPFISTRYQNGKGTFTFTGTASNAGNGLSSVIYCNLANNTSIPETAVAVDIYMSCSMSTSIGGTTKGYLKSGDIGWAESRSSTFPIRFDLGVEYGMYVRKNWQFMYSQTAYAGTKMSNVTMTVYWVADIAENNHNLWT